VSEQQNEGKSPEEIYQEEYDKALAEMEAEEAGESASKPKDEPESENQNSGDEVASADSGDEQENGKEADSEQPADDDPIAQAQKQIETLEKRLSDAQKWGHDQSRQLKELQKQREELERLQNRPGILDEWEGLEEGIKHVVGGGKSPEAADPRETWIETVTGAHPDFDQLADEDPEFAKDVDSRLSSNDVSNPVDAIRHITDAKIARAQRIAESQKLAAIEKAKKDFEAKQGKKAAMSVPGSGAGNIQASPGQDREAVAHIENMSDEEFAALANKTVGRL